MTLEQKATAEKRRVSKPVWAGVLLLVAGWMFVLGLLVGRGTAPVPVDAFELSDALAKLKAAMMNKEQTKAAAVKEDDTAAEPELEFYRALKEPQTQIPKQLSQVPSQSAKAAATPKLPLADKKVPSEARAAVKEGIERPAEPAAATVIAKKEGPATETKPKSGELPPASGAKPASPAAMPSPSAQAANDRYTIQVAAVKDAPSADELVSQLKGKSFPAYQIRLETPGQGIWYRVRVGAFKDRPTAEAMRTKLMKAKFQAMVVATPAGSP